MGMTPNLTGPMASRRYLIGFWTCTIRVGTAVSGSRSSKEVVPVTFSTAPNDTLQASVRARSFFASAFFGYSAPSKKYWISAIDNTGARVFETSAGGSTFIGTVTTEAGVKTVRDIWTKSSDTAFATETDILDKGVWKKSASHTCTKS
jgi:hypothetical protein